MTNVAVLGLGPAGVATGLSLSVHGHGVAAYDIDEARRSAIAEARPPFHEGGLEVTLRREVRAGRFHVVSDVVDAIRLARVIFLCVGTPPRPDGTMDDSALRSAAESLARSWPDSRRRVVVVKSTVVPGTTERVVAAALRSSGVPFRIAANPEFLQEGRALAGSLRPDRVVLGVDHPSTARQLRRLYGFARCPFVVTDIRTAETIKHATNAALATKIAFADELANVCETLGVSYDEVHRGLSLDPRINPKFLVPGTGPGGSCLPKDVRAMVAASRQHGYDAPLLDAVSSHNEVQYRRAIALLEAELGSPAGKRIAILGLSFKGGTDDVRESRAIPISKSLLDKGAVVVGYDPMAGPAFSRAVPEVKLAKTVGEALVGADGCIVQADWPEVSRLTAKDFRRTMRTPVVVDGRRILDPRKMKGVRFRRIG